MNQESQSVSKNLFDGIAVAFAALVAGARSIPMGDNSAVLRELAERAAEAGYARRPASSTDCGSGRSDR